MTNQTTQTVAAVEETKEVVNGRPLTEKGMRTKISVTNFIHRTEGNFTTKDVRKAVMQSKVYVNNRVNALIREGVIVKVGSRVVGRGRPYAVYARVEK